jgi:hypothetical protein
MKVFIFSQIKSENKMAKCHSEKQKSTVAINQTVFTWKSCSYFEQLLARN